MKVLVRVFWKRRSDVRCQLITCSLASCVVREPLVDIFIMRQVQEKHQAKKKKLYYAFVDLKIESQGKW